MIGVGGTMIGVWANADGRRGTAEVGPGELLFEAPAPQGGVFDHIHLEDPNVGGLTVWCWESREEGAELNLFVVALVASCGGGVRPIAGPAFITGPMGDDGGFTGLTPEQADALVAATIAMPGTETAADAGYVATEEGTGA